MPRENENETRTINLNQKGNGKGNAKVRGFKGTPLEIQQKLENYTQLENKKQLENLKPYKNWVRYFDKKTKKFNIGGLFVKVNEDISLIYIRNTVLKSTWTIKVDDNIVFIPTNPVLRFTKEDIIKEKLYRLYLEGRLKVLPKV